MNARNDHPYVKTVPLVQIVSVVILVYASMDGRERFVQKILTIVQGRLVLTERRASIELVVSTANVHQEKQVNLIEKVCSIGVTSM